MLCVSTKTVDAPGVAFILPSHNKIRDTRKGPGVAKMVKHDVGYYLISLSKNFSRMVDTVRAENGHYAETELHQGAP